MNEMRNILWACTASLLLMGSLVVSSAASARDGYENNHAGNTTAPGRQASRGDNGNGSMTLFSHGGNLYQFNPRSPEEIQKAYGERGPGKRDTRLQDDRGRGGPGSAGNPDGRENSNCGNCR